MPFVCGTPSLRRFPWHLPCGLVGRQSPFCLDKISGCLSLPCPLARLPFALCPAFIASAASFAFGSAGLEFSVADARSNSYIVLRIVYGWATLSPGSIFSAELAPGPKCSASLRPAAF